MHPRRVLSFDLKDLLELFKHEINDSMWLCEYVEATATSSPNVEELANNNELVSSCHLVCAAKNTNQVIDGVFRAVSDNIEWLRIEAIDSSYWEVYSLKGRGNK